MAGWGTWMSWHPPPDATGCGHLREWPDPHLPGEGAAGRDEGPRGCGTVERQHLRGRPIPEVPHVQDDVTLVVGLQDPQAVLSQVCAEALLRACSPWGPRHRLSGVQGPAGTPDALELPTRPPLAGPPAALYRPGPPLSLWGRLSGGPINPYIGAHREWGCQTRVHSQLMVYSPLLPVLLQTTATSVHSACNLEPSG